MLILWAFFVFSQDPTKKIVPNFTPNPILRIIEKTSGSNRHEKALNYVEDLCQSVAAQVQEKKTVRPKDKELVTKELETLAKAFALAKKENTEVNYSSAMGSMSRFLVIVIRNIPGQEFYGEPAKKLRDNCARVLDEMRPGVIIPEDLEGFIEKAKGENQKEKTIRGVGLFCQSIFKNIVEKEKLLPSQKDDLVDRWNDFVNSGNARIEDKKALTLIQWEEIRKLNFQFFATVNSVTKDENRYGLNFRDFHGACLKALNKIKP